MSSPGPNKNDVSRNSLGDDVNEKEGHTAHVWPSAPGRDGHTEQNVPFRQASDMAPLGHCQLTEDVWEDVLDEGEVNLNATVSIVDPEPTAPLNSSNMLCEPRERPQNSSLTVNEHGHSNSSESASDEDLASATRIGGLSPMAVHPPVGAVSGSCEDLETLNAELADSYLVKLLRQARSGRFLDTLDHERFQAVKIAGDFLFSAGLTEDAFVIYHWIYDSLKSAPHAARDLLFSAVIDLARSTAAASQDSICRTILLQMLHDRGARKDRESQETFLLHAFLTMIFRRQEDLARADFHCHRALECFLYPKKQSARSNNSWQSLVWVAYCHLGGSLTGERLSRFHRELDVESRQRVLSRASDHLINASRHLWSGDVRMLASCSVRPFSRLETVSEDDAEGSSVLKDLLYWCAKALNNAKVTRSLRQSWRKVRKSGTKLRDLGITTLYCILHQQWRDENTAAHMPSGRSASWTSRMKSEFDLMPNECLAAVPEMLAVTWPYMDEDMPLLSNWRTCLFKLQKRALREIAKLLIESDRRVAHLFFEAYSFQSIPNANRVETGCSPGKALHAHILQISSTAGKPVPSEYPGERFELDAMDFQQGLDPRDRLPSLAPSRDNSLLSRSHLSLTRRTSMHSHPSNRSKGSRGSVRTPLRNRSDASMNSRSSGLASMKSMSKRISHALATREQEAPSEPPSAAVPDMIDEAMDLEHLMGAASRSLESLSLDSEVGDGTAEL